MRKLIGLLIAFFITIYIAKAQETDANIFGEVTAEGEHLPFVSVYLKDTQYGTMTDLSGHYMLTNLPIGKHTLVASLIGFKPVEKEIEILADKSLEVNFALEEKVMSLDDVVVTGTKTFKRKTESAVVVNVLEGKKLEMLQAGTLSEGLAFQPGLRMETDCQTCNYTQLRMNGLGGGYSQILIKNSIRANITTIGTSYSESLLTIDIFGDNGEINFNSKTGTIINYFHDNNVYSEKLYAPNLNNEKIWQIGFFNFIKELNNALQKNSFTEIENQAVTFTNIKGILNY